MGYRQRLYPVYVSTHTGPADIERDPRRASRVRAAWRYYFRRFLPAGTSARILDLGCGDGVFVAFLRHSGYQHVEGVDISAEQVALSRKLGVPGITCGDFFEYLKDREGAYDLVFARDVIEHLTKDEVLDAFDAVHRALREGGLFVVQVPNGESPLAGRIRYGDFTHQLSFTRTSLRQVFAATGFADFSCFPAGPAPVGLKSAVRFALWKGLEYLFRFYLLVETGSSQGIASQTVIAAGAKRQSAIARKNTSTGGERL